MATVFKTPGVYINEITKLPPSVAQVETAIPAFIGYTETAKDKIADDLRGRPRRITSMVDYERYFGKTPLERFTIDVDEQPARLQIELTVVESPEFKFRLFYAMQHFFANGGGPCYVISVGDFSGTVAKDDLKRGIGLAASVDEVTLLVWPDGAAIAGDADFGELVDLALAQCHKLQDRFAIIDVPDRHKDNNSITTNFRGRIRNEPDFIKYGAAYYPYLETTFNFRYLDFDQKKSHARVGKHTRDGAPINAVAAAATQTAYNDFAAKTAANDLAIGNLQKVLRNETLADRLKNTVDIVDAAAGTTLADVLAAATRAANGELLPATFTDVATDTKPKLKTAAATNKTAATAAVTAATTALTTAAAAFLAAKVVLDNSVSASAGLGDFSFLNLIDLRDKNNALYNRLRSKIEEIRVVLPPSSAMAGIYASTDNDRGVWKAPANSSVSAIIQPTVEVNDDFQNDLNVHDTGKSINAIRAFVGRGTIVWGARTLAGNDNEWRYISVRRFFNMAEESIKKSSQRFVFEPNDANTWVRVKAMIENFLFVLWRQGALAGAKPEHAYFVKVGLDETMTPLDILEGRMIVEIGMAAVRPAEFILLQFSHKMQES